MLVAGDFNCLIGDLEQAQWPQRCGLVACRQNEHATVHAPGGRSIDHIFVSATARPLILSTEERVFAWRPHVGLWCCLSRRPCALVGPQAVLPRPLPVVKPLKGPISELPFHAGIWDMAQDLAIAQLPGGDDLSVVSRAAE